jgi:hypothetical protein
MKPDDTKIKNLVPKPFLEEQIKVEAFFVYVTFFSICASNKLSVIHHHLAN